MQITSATVIMERITLLLNVRLFHNRQEKYYFLKITYLCQQSFYVLLMIFTLSVALAVDLPFNILP